MMVKYISFMIILGVSLLFTSCVYYFDLDEAEGIPKLVVLQLSREWRYNRGTFFHAVFQSQARGQLFLV